MKKMCCSIAFSLIVFSAGQATANLWTYQGLGDLATGPFQSAGYDVSDDGSAVVGNSVTSVNTKAFHWTEGGGMVPLEGSTHYSHSSGISADGNTAVGWDWNQSIGRVEAFRWTQGGGIQFLGDLTGGTFESYANDVSADGNIVVGFGHSDSGYEAAYWTSESGWVGIGDLPGGSFHSSAFGVSKDGSVIVGAADSTFDGGGNTIHQEAFRWTEGGGMVGLGDLDGGSFLSHAEDVLDGGNLVIGYGTSVFGKEAFRWTQATGMVGLGDLDGGIFSSHARGGSEDGSLIVGTANTALGSEAFIWDLTNGMRNLRDVLIVEHNVDLTGWTLTTAWAMSADGNAITGTGINPDGNTEAWLAQLAPTQVVPEPSTIASLMALAFCGSVYGWRRRQDNSNR